MSDVERRMRALASGHLAGAASRLIDARAAFARGAYAETVRYSQEIVELSLKACLGLVLVEYPRARHVGDVVRMRAERFPKWFAEGTPELEKISDELARERAASMYGVESEGKKPSDLFGREEADLRLRQAGDVLGRAIRLRDETFTSGGETKDEGKEAWGSAEGPRGRDGGLLED